MHQNMQKICRIILWTDVYKRQESSTKKVIMVMMVSVPERPSTPSEQFVTLIDTQTKMTVSIPNTTGGIFTEPPNMAKVIVLELKCRRCV